MLVTLVLLGASQAQWRTIQDDAFLPGYLKEQKQQYKTWEEAAHACDLELDCPGFTLEQRDGGPPAYTLRQTKFPLSSKTGERSWIKELIFQNAAAGVRRSSSSHPSSMPEPMQRILNSKATSPTNPESSSGSKIPTILLDPPRVGSSSLGDIIPAAYESISPERLFPIADKLQETFKSGEPFPHVVIDGLFPTELLRNVAMELPDFAMPAEQQCPDNFQCHENEGTSRKLASESEHEWGGSTRFTYSLLRSKPFVEFVVRLTGIEFLLVDAMNVGGGLHLTQSGGSLRVHADFNRLTARYQLDRRVNVFLYLNEDWTERHGGSLELWDRFMTTRKQSIPPLLNRLVIFASSDFSYHGHPQPWANRAHPRRSLAMYLYTNGGRPSSEVDGDPSCAVYNCIPVRLNTHSTLWQSSPDVVSPLDRRKLFEAEAAAARDF